MQSHSVQILPNDSRCKYWAKIVRKDNVLTVLPHEVEGASDIPVTYSQKGDEELFEGDILIEGEENHHRKIRGWSYTVTTVINGKIRVFYPDSDTKKQIKEAGIEPKYLAGAGAVAGAVRVYHAIKLGILI